MEISLATILMIVCTALLSSLFTLAVGYLFFKLYLKAVLDQELDELGDDMKERLRAGVLEAGRELQPEFRDEVREGFKEAMADAVSGDLVQRTAANMARNSSSMVEQGLNILLGRPQDNKTE